MLAAGVLAAILALVSVAGGLRGARVSGVTAMACDPEGRVAVAVDGVVLVARGPDQSPVTLSRNTAGRPFEYVTSLAFAADGTLYVADGNRQRLDRYSSSGEPAGLIAEGQGLARGSFEAAPLSDGRVAVADTLGHRLLVLDREGKVLATRTDVRYPNGINTLDLDRIFVAETGRARVHVLDATLADDSSPPQSRPPYRYLPNRQSYALHVDGTGTAAITECSTRNQDCDVIRVRPSGQASRVATLSFVTPPDLPGVEELSLVSAVCTLPSGEVLVGSDRLSALVAFSDGNGGPPGVLGEQALPKATLAELQSGQSVPLATGVVAQLWDRQGIFGPGTRRAGQARLDLARVEAGARYGLYALLAALLAIYLIGRTTGAFAVAKPGAAKQGSSRARTVWRDLVTTDAGAWLAYALCVALGTAGAFVASLPVLGFASAAACGLGAGFLVARGFGVRLLVRRRSHRHAARAFELYFGPQGWLGTLVAPGETVRLACYSHQVRAEDVIERHWDDFLDLLFPRLTLLVITDEAILAFPCSIFGAPLGRCLRVELGGGQGSASLDRSVLHLRPEAWRYALLLECPPSAARVVAKEPMALGHAVFYCGECAAPVSRERTRACEHERSRPRVAMALGFLFPGLGHLYARLFRRGRLLTTVALAEALEVGYWTLFAVTGSLPVEPLQILAPATALLFVWAAAVVDLERKMARDTRERKQAGWTEVADIAERRRHLHALRRLHPAVACRDWNRDFLQRHLEAMRAAGVGMASLRLKHDTFARWLKRA
jgi:hypothetical protein